MEDGKGWEVINWQEDGGNHVSEQPNNASRDKDHLNIFANSISQHLSEEEASDCNHCFSEETKNASSQGNNGESSGVLGDDPERLLGSVAEAHIVKSNLNVGVFVHEFHAAIKALEVASDNACDDLENNVVFHASLFVLVYAVLEDNPDGGHNSDCLLYTSPSPRD